MFLILYSFFFTTAAMWLHGWQLVCRSVHFFGPNLNKYSVVCHEIWYKYPWYPEDES